MNTARLTPGIVLAALVVGTLLGPLSTLREVTVADLNSPDYWQGILADTIRAASSATVAVISVLAGSLGLPLLRGGRGVPPETPPP